MFQKKFRLPYYIRFSHPITVHSASFILKYIPSSNSFNRYGVIVGKTVSTRATMRNRLKRQLRFSLESMHPQIKKGYDMLFIIKKRTGAIQTNVLGDEIRQQLKKQTLL